MAVDSAQKRFAIMNHGCPWRGVMIVPTGTVDAAERAAFMYHYGGIAWSIAAPSVDERTMIGFAALAVSSGDKFRVRVQRTDGTDNLQTVNGGSGLMALFLRQIP